MGGKVMENKESKTFIVRSTTNDGNMWVSRLDFDDIDSLTIEEDRQNLSLKIYLKGDRLNFIPLNEEGKKIMVNILSWYDFHSKGFCSNE